MTNTPSGLLVPRTALRPLPASAPHPVGNVRSVDVRLTPPAGPNACPQTWQIGAQLSPVFGEARLGQAVTLAVGQWTNTPLQLVLPEPGRYYVHFDVDTQICATVDFGGNDNLWIQVRAIVLQTGAVAIGSVTGAQHQFSLDNGSRIQSCQTGSTGLTGIIGTNSRITVRVQGMLQRGSGTVGTTIQSRTIRGDSQGAFHKITD